MLDFVRTMSFRDDLSTAADIADIVALQQRAELIATQNAQLSTLRQLRDQAQIQAFELEREKTLQNTLFDLRRALVTLANSTDQTPQKAAADLFLAEQTLRLVPPEAFALLEWKELSVNVQQELAATTDALRQRHGEVITNELIELRDAVRADSMELRAHAIQTKRAQEEALRQQGKAAARQDKIAAIVIVSIIVVLFVLVFLLITSAR